MKNFNPKQFKKTQNYNPEHNIFINPRVVLLDMTLFLINESNSSGITKINNSINIFLYKESIFTIKKNESVIINGSFIIDAFGEPKTLEYYQDWEFQNEKNTKDSFKIKELVIGNTYEKEDGQFFIFLGSYHTVKKTNRLQLIYLREYNGGVNITQPAITLGAQSKKHFVLLLNSKDEVLRTENIHMFPSKYGSKRLDFSLLKVGKNEPKIIKAHGRNCGFSNKIINFLKIYAFLNDYVYFSENKFHEELDLESKPLSFFKADFHQDINKYIHRIMENRTVNPSDSYFYSENIAYKVVNGSDSYFYSEKEGRFLSPPNYSKCLTTLIGSSFYDDIIKIVLTKKSK